jgi:hypothetical protein
MKNLKFAQLGAFLLMFAVFFTACDEGNLLISIDSTENESLFLVFEDEDDVDLSCVEFVYPLTLNNPDGSTTIITDEAALVTTIEGVDQNAPLPTLVFPIQIIDENDLPKTITTEEELCEIFIECLMDDFDDCDCEDEEECFEINYPITLILPDGTQVVVNDDDQLETTIDNYYNTNPNDTGEVDVVYPVNVTMLEDGSVVTINNESDLDAVFESCYNDFYEECFEIQFPISVQMPDNSVITANDGIALDSLYEAWILANPNVTAEPTLIFPITVVYDDGTTDTANDEDELMELYEECFEFLDDCSGMVRSSDLVIGTSSDAVERVIIQKSKTKNKEKK